MTTANTPNTQNTNSAPAEPGVIELHDTAVAFLKIHRIQKYEHVFPKYDQQKVKYAHICFLAKLLFLFFRTSIYRKILIGSVAF